MRTGHEYDLSRLAVTAAFRSTADEELIAVALSFVVTAADTHGRCLKSHNRRFVIEWGDSLAANPPAGIRGAKSMSEHSQLQSLR